MPTQSRLLFASVQSWPTMACSMDQELVQASLSSHPPAPAQSPMAPCFHMHVCSLMLGTPAHLDSHPHTPPAQSPMARSFHLQACSLMLRTPSHLDSPKGPTSEQKTGHLSRKSEVDTTIIFIAVNSLLLSALHLPCLCCLRCLLLLRSRYVRLRSRAAK
jgi:hypothetical protein